MRPTRRFSPSRYALLLLLTACLTGCGGAASTRAPAGDGPEPLPAAYMEAARDAVVADPGEIDSSLTRVVPSNERLTWSQKPIAGEATRVVKVVTWTGPRGFAQSGDPDVGEPVPLKDGRTVWVTVVPDVRDACGAFTTDEAGLDRRLKQLLGLPPTSEKTRFVELWVSPDALHRPCPDPEVTDTACRLGDPEPNTDRRFRTWFARQRAGAYCGDRETCPAAVPYPWTRLGYTYDWAPTSGEVGVSEFVVLAPNTVIFAGSTPTSRYCHGAE